jgi:hypothetical protein
VVKDPKSKNEADGNFIYHFIATPLRVLRKILSQIISSLKELDEHQRWKFMIWFKKSSPGFP